MAVSLIALRCRTADRFPGAPRGVEILAPLLAHALGVEPRYIGSGSEVEETRYEADLRPPFADLPDPDAFVARPTPVVPSDAPPLVLRAGMSTIKRSGTWDVPPRLRLQSAMGSVVLDFCDTAIPHAVVDIEVDLGAGSAKLLVPDDSTANVDDVVASMGTVKSSVPSVPRPGVPHFVVHGRAGMGSVTVRRRYRIAGRYF